MNTLLIADHDNATLKDATAKALTAALALGGTVDVLVAGKDCGGAAAAAAKLAGVAKVLLAEVSSGRSLFCRLASRNFDRPGSPADPTVSTEAEPPSLAAWKPAVRTVMTFLASVA